MPSNKMNTMKALKEKQLAAPETEAEVEEAIEGPRSPSPLDLSTTSANEDFVKKRGPRNSNRLTQKQEDETLGWMRDNSVLWRRGHMEYRQTNKKEEVWKKQALHLGVTVQHLKGWWKRIQAWYTVSSRKRKSGQALTDREAYLLEKCKFYQGH